MPQRTLQATAVRPAETFEPYPGFAHVPAEELNRWLEAVRIQPVSALEWEWPRGFVLEPRAITDSMWFLLVKGRLSGWVGHESRTVELAPGDLVLIPQYVQHSLVGGGGEQPTLIAVHFFATLFGIDILGCLGFPPVLHGNRRGRLTQRTRALAHDFAVKAPGWRQSMSADILAVLLHAIRNQPDQFSLKPGQDTSALPRLFPALEWIEARLGDHSLDLHQLAETVHLSSTHFGRLFLHTFSESPIHFIRSRRIDRACLLLRTTDYGLKQIADLCGFNDIGYFCRTFRQLIGRTPTAYRLTLPL